MLSLFSSESDEEDLSAAKAAGTEPDSNGKSLDDSEDLSLNISADSEPAETEATVRAFRRPLMLVSFSFLLHISS